MTDDVNCLVIIIAKDDNNIVAVQFEIKLFYFLFAQLTDFNYTAIILYKLSKCIGQTPCSFEHYLVIICNYVLIHELKTQILQHITQARQKSRGCRIHGSSEFWFLQSCCEF